MGKQLIIISETEEPGTFDRESDVAIITVDYDEVYKWSVLTERLKADHPSFSELRLFGSYVEYYIGINGNDLLDELTKIAEATPDKITPETVEEMRTEFGDNHTFLWPDGIEFDMEALWKSHRDEDDESSEEDDSTSMSVDIEEVIAESGDFRFGAYSGDQQVFTHHIPYSWLASEVLKLAHQTVKN